MLISLLRDPPIPVDEAARHGRRVLRASRIRRPRKHLPNGSLDVVQSAAMPDQDRRGPYVSGLPVSGNEMCLAPCFAGCTKEEYEVEVSGSCNSGTTWIGQVCY